MSRERSFDRGDVRDEVRDDVRDDMREEGGFDGMREARREEWDRERGRERPRGRGRERGRSGPSGSGGPPPRGLGVPYRSKDVVPRATLYVTGFVKGTSAKRLAEVFEAYGPLAQVNVMPPRQSDGEQYAFVAFRKIDDMNAILDDLEGGTVLDDGLALDPNRGIACERARRLPVSQRHIERRRFDGGRRDHGYREDRRGPDRRYDERGREYRRDDRGRGRRYDEYDDAGADVHYTQGRGRERSYSPVRERRGGQGSRGDGHRDRDRDRDGDFNVDRYGDSNVHVNVNADVNADTGGSPPPPPPMRDD